MSTRIDICILVDVSLSLSIHTYIYIYIYIYIYMYLYLYISSHIYVYFAMYLLSWLSIYLLITSIFCLYLDPYPSITKQHNVCVYIYIYIYTYNPPCNFLYKIATVKLGKMLRFRALLCLGVPTQCQRLQFYRGPWHQRFYRDFMLNTALSTSQLIVLGATIL